MQQVSQPFFDGNPHGNVPRRADDRRDGLVSRAAEFCWLWRERHRSRANLIGLPDADFSRAGLAHFDRFPLELLGAARRMNPDRVRHR